MQYLVRYSEIGTKAPGTRRRFLRRFEANMKDAFARENIKADIRVTLPRAYVRSKDAHTADVLARLFGVQSVSAVEVHALSTLDDLVARGVKRFADAVSGKRFAVRARRVGGHPFTSGDIERSLGAALIDHALGVDLTNPEVTAYVEVRDKTFSFFVEKVPGPGGLPLGSQDRALVLLSGGFDSAVAAWEMMKRGVGVDYLFFNLGGPIHEQGVFRVAKKVFDTWQYGDDASLIVVPFAPVVENIRANTESAYWNLVLKRAMLDVGATVAKQRRLLGIVTGDSIGQVSSQTMANLYALGVGTMPIFRPLLTRDKEEIIDKARFIGTNDLSAAVDEYCAIVPEHPVTSATPGGLGAQWEKIDGAVLADVINQARTLSLTTLRLADGSTLLDVTRADVPSEARVIDVRERDAFDTWHVDGAEQLDIHDAMRQLDDLPKETPVLFVCEHGLLSAELAQMARERGVDAWSFAGGVPALRDFIEK